MVRIATEADKADIVELLRHAPYSHVHADWRLPVDWLGQNSFVVIPKTPLPPRVQSFADRLFSQRCHLLGCLVATADPAPAAWVRAAALDYVEQPEVALGRMLAEVEASLVATAVTHLGWLVIEPWPLAWLDNFDFYQTNEIETLVKEDLSLPALPAVTDLTIRPVELSDMADLAALETAAFEPLWRHSLQSLCLAYKQTISFEVAEWRGQLAGFQFSTAARHRGAHLSRLTVTPTAHGQGIGAALLAQAIKGYRQRNLAYVSLNTQVDNNASLRLYQRFGFRPTNDRLPVMIKSL